MQRQSKMKQELQYEIINYGYEASQYFPGYGTAGSKYSNVAIGIGYDAVEAYQDALEQVAEVDPAAADALPGRPYGISKRNKVPNIYRREDYDTFWYVIILWSSLECTCPRAITGGAQ